MWKCSGAAILCAAGQRDGGDKRQRRSESLQYASSVHVISLCAGKTGEVR